ncbi:WavE lipopolysaccharide synthesis family protein [Sphingobium sp.]|uniref:WavE lipopolysaccharide synthesis family protein n=1 Tax=Sphingobium sp. TaxID=1912891 RepID=UPI0035C6DCC5
MIDGKDISVIMQGPVDWTHDPVSGLGITFALYQNVRKLLPDAEVILSTWANQKIDDFGFDKIVQSKDPGPQGTWPSFVPNNVNRQIVSTVAGLKAATRKYALKIRTDMVLQGVEFIEAFEKAKPLKADKRNIFSRPIITNNLSSRNTSEILERLPNHPLPFHPSDHASFGLREDILALWDIPLQSDDEAYHFLDRSQPNRFRLADLSKLAPEQYVMTNAVAKKVPVDIRHYADMRKEVITLSEFYFSTHIISMPDRLFPIHFPKYHTDHHFSFEWMRRNPDEKLLHEKDQGGVPASGQPELKKKPPMFIRAVTYPFRKPQKFKERVTRFFAS